VEAVLNHVNEIVKKKCPITYVIFLKILMMDVPVLSKKSHHVKLMPVHQNANILHGLVGPNVLQHVVAVRNHVIVNANVQMAIHQIFVRIMDNVTASHVKKKIATQILNVHQNVNSVQIGNHGCHALRLVVAEPRADKRNVNARTLINAKAVKVYLPLIILNVILNHAHAGVTGLHGLNVLTRVVKMLELVKEKTSVNILVPPRAKLWKLKSALVTVVTGDAGTNGLNVTVHVMKDLELDHVNAIVLQVHQLMNVHALANQTNPNHVTFHPVKISAILVSGVDGRTVIPSVDQDSKLG
jgi:hypothetical protein